MEEPVKIGDWRKIADLGAGAFGTVALWRNMCTEESYAIKKCKIQLLENLTPRQKERWKNEVEVMKKIDNENIVSFKKVPDNFLKELNKYNPTKLPILSMEYCSKGNLRNYLKKSENMRGLPEIEVRCILNDISNAIAYLHNMDITHRDLKPENIVLHESSTRQSKTIYKVIDLGYAKELQTLGLSFVGTLPYLAPEIYKNVKYDKTVDFWSFGITAYEIITGELPFLPLIDPIKRFEYIRKKSEDDIYIWMTSSGKVEYSNEILKENFITQELKRNIEYWLRLVLQYDPQKRGIYKGQYKHIIRELRTILTKKIINIFSIYNLEMYSFEITDFTTFGGLKMLIEKSSSVPRDEQIIIHGDHVDFYSDQHLIVDSLTKVNYETVFYVYKKDNYIDEKKKIAIPKTLESILCGDQMEKIELLRELCWKAIYFVMKEKGYFEMFKFALNVQMKLNNRLLTTQRQLYSDLRENLLKLLARIDSYNELNRHVEGKIDTKYLVQYKKLLWQAKELTENFNGLTERYLKFSRRYEQHIAETSQKIEGTLKENNLQKLCDGTIRLHGKISFELDKKSRKSMSLSAPTSNFHRDLAQILSEVIKIQSKDVIANSDLKKFTLLSLKARKHLQLLYTWSTALSKEINRISQEISDNQCARQALPSYNQRGFQVQNYLIQKKSLPGFRRVSLNLKEFDVLIGKEESCNIAIETSNAVTHDFQSPSQVSFSIDMNSSMTESNSLLQQNMDLRYQIQEAMNINSAYLRNLQNGFYRDFGATLY